MIEEGLRSRAASLVLPLLVLLGLPVLILLPALHPGMVLSSSDLLLDSYLMDGARPEGFEARNVLLGDPVLQMAPWQDFASREFAQNRVPYWDPHAELGVSFLGAGQTAFFDPLGLPHLLGRGSSSSVLTALLRLLLAAAGAFVFARRVGASAPAATLAGVAYGCGGFMVVWLLYANPSSAAWFPWAMVAAESYRRTRSARWVLGLGAFLGLSALGGQFEVAFFAALASSAYVMLRRPEEGSARSISPVRLLGAIAGAGVVAFVLAAPAVLPFVENLSQASVISERADHHGPVVSLGGFRWERAALLVYPYAFGRPLRGEGSVLGSRGNFCENNGGYASLLALVLAAVGFAVSRRGSPGRVLGLLGFAALVLVTRVPPLAGFWRQLPVAGLAVPERSVFVLLFAIAVLAGLGADVLARPATRPGLRALACALAVALVLAGAVAAALGSWFALAPGSVAAAVARGAGALGGLAPGTLARAAEFGRDAARLAPVFARHFLLPWSAFALGSALLLAVRRRVGPRTWIWLAVALVAGDLYCFGHSFNPAIPSSQHFPETPQIRSIRRAAAGQRVLVLDQRLGNPANLGTEYGWRGVLGYDVLGRRRAESLLGLEGGFPRGPASFPLLHYDRTDPMILDLLSVRAVASREPLDSPGLVPAGRLGSGFLYLNPDTLGEVSMPGSCIVVRDEEEARAALSAAGFDPGREAVVEAPAGSIFGVARGILQVARPAPNRIRVTGTLSHGGLVVVNEGYDPAWTARIGGEVVEILPSDLAFMGVRLPAGPVDLDLNFMPRTWPLVEGLWVLALIAAAAATLRRRHLSRRVSTSAAQPGGLSPRAADARVRHRRGFHR